MDNNTFLFQWSMVFVLLGFLVPFVADDIGVSSSTLDIDQINKDVSQTELNDVGILDVLASIVTMFFWNVAGIPTILNIILLIPRTIFWVVVYDKIRGI